MDKVSGNAIFQRGLQMSKDKQTFKEIEKQNTKVKHFYKAWEKADNAQKLLRSALEALEESAKVFTKEEVCPAASFVDGITIQWEDFNIWGDRNFFSPEEFLDACKQRKTKE